MVEQDNISSVSQVLPLEPIGCLRWLHRRWRNPIGLRWMWQLFCPIKWIQQTGETFHPEHESQTSPGRNITNITGAYWSCQEIFYLFFLKLKENTATLPSDYNNSFRLLQRWQRQILSITKSLYTLKVFCFFSVPLLQSTEAIMTKWC